MVDTFRVRFRFRLQKKLNIKARSHTFKIREHEAVLSSQLDDVDICESQWLILNVRGFKSEINAREFGSRLKTACELSSVATRLGIDPGTNLATAQIARFLKDQYREQTALSIRDNVHGIDVFPDEPNVRIFTFNATGSVLTDATTFLSDLSVFIDTDQMLKQRTKDILLLLNYALMQPEPVAQIVFAISAVELLGQQETWSDDQKCLLETLATHADAAKIGTQNERQEVADSIRRGTHRLGLRQGVMRLLDSLDLGTLKKKWDELYAQRSALMHGLAPTPGASYAQLAADAVTLCGKILLKEIEKEVATVNRHVDIYYKT